MDILLILQPLRRFAGIGYTFKYIPIHFIMGVQLKYLTKSKSYNLTRQLRSQRSEVRILSGAPNLPRYPYVGEQVRQNCQEQFWTHASSARRASAKDGASHKVSGKTLWVHFSAAVGRAPGRRESILSGAPIKSMSYDGTDDF